MGATREMGFRAPDGESSTAPSPIPPNNASKPTTVTSPSLHNDQYNTQQQLDTIIYSGEFDDDVVPFPNIHVSPLRRSEQFESSVSRSFPQLAAGCRASTSSAPIPFGQFQNFQGPVKSTQLKIGAVVPTPPAEARRAVYAPDCDADDEKILSARIEPRYAMPTSTQMPKQGNTASSSNEKFSSKPLEILPSSQEAEVELLNNLDNDSSTASDETNPPQQPLHNRPRLKGV
ncbi:hypothetical protein BU17DRAFT_95002 [Hysterangium stoloniferum]|nr:hypothetical protein BU17DRAFT_95002 [Hysterangium stoloniferum]